MDTAAAEAFCDDLVGCWGVVYADEAAAEAGGGEEGGSAAGVAVDHGVAGVGGGADDVFQEAGVFLGGVGGSLGVFVEPDVLGEFAGGCAGVADFAGVARRGSI